MPIIIDFPRHATVTSDIVGGTDAGANEGAAREAGLEAIEGVPHAAVLGAGVIEGAPHAAVLGAGVIEGVPHAAVLGAGDVGAE
jgi:hypothetical protein